MLSKERERENLRLAKDEMRERERERERENYFRFRSSQRTEKGKLADAAFDGGFLLQTKYKT